MNRRYFSIRTPELRSFRNKRHLALLPFMKSSIPPSNISIFSRLTRTFCLMDYCICCIRHDSGSLGESWTSPQQRIACCQGEVATAALFVSVRLNDDLDAFFRLCYQPETKRRLVQRQAMGDHFVDWNSAGTNQLYCQHTVQWCRAV